MPPMEGNATASVHAPAIGVADAKEDTMANKRVKTTDSEPPTGRGRGRNLMHVDGHAPDIALAYCYVIDAMEGR